MRGQDNDRRTGRESPAGPFRRPGGFGKQPLKTEGVAGIIDKTFVWIGGFAMPDEMAVLTGQNQIEGTVSAVLFCNEENGRSEEHTSELSHMA